MTAEENCQSFRRETKLVDSNSKTVQKKTLLVRHLPPYLSDEQKEELMKHFGAIHVKGISSKFKKSNLLFATFPSEATAKEALSFLHQLDILGYPLTVEFAKGDVTVSNQPEVKPAVQFRKENKENCQKHYENFLHKLNTWHNTVNFTQPPPAHLRYQYPPPSHPVLLNIMRALVSVPKFYTQVLHLMNKMNLPCPFDVTFPEPDILKERPEPTIHEPQAADVLQEEEMMTSTEESEIESEDDSSQALKDVIPVKRTLPQMKVKVKRPKFFKPPTAAATASTKQSTKPEEVFEKVERETVQKKISLILTSEASGFNPPNPNPFPSDPQETTSGFGFISPTHKDTADEREDRDMEEEEKEEKEKIASKEQDEKPCITSKELAANRISSRDQRHLSVYKNYQPGIPSCRLYIKNLSKHVEPKDLRYIYSKYIIPNYEEQGSMFDIRLMQEGRMKGQAFITLQNVKQAQRALSETNGYILKDKPMVVQFARSAVPKAT